MTLIGVKVSTVYQRGETTGSPVGSWILADGTWNDSGIWKDEEVWKDSI